MKEVVSLIGSSAGQTKWMQEHAADAALATGAVALPGSNEAINIRVRLGLNDENEFVDDNVRVDIKIARKDGAIVLVEDWPKCAVIPRRLLNTNMVQTKESGAIIIRIGEDEAVYQAVNNLESDEIWADLQEITNETEDRGESEQEDDTDNDPTIPGSNDGGGSEPGDGDSDAEIPENWEEMHWKHKIQLAERIVGEEVGNLETAVDIIKMFSSNR